MTTPTTPDQARYAAVLIDPPTLYTGPEHRVMAASALRSLAAQVEALTAELQIKNAECDLFQHGCDLRDAELDRLKKQEPIARIIDNGTDEGGTEWVARNVSGDTPLAQTGDLLYLSTGAQPDTKELAELRADAELKMDLLLAHCTDAECPTCAEIICPAKCAMHFHHDGCPACAELDAAKAAS